MDDRYRRDAKKEDRYKREDKTDERSVDRSKKRSKDRRMRTRSDRRPNRNNDRKVLVAEESTKNWVDTDSESSSISSSSSDSEQEEVHCFMADQTSDDEVFNFSNVEFTREDLVSALNDMVKEYRKLSHSFEEVKAENISLKSSSIESSSDELEDIDRLKIEFRKLTAENDFLRNESSELKAEVEKLTKEMSSWNQSARALHKLHEIQKSVHDRTGFGFNSSDSSEGETSTQSQPAYDKFNKMSFVKANMIYDCYEIFDFRQSSQSKSIEMASTFISNSYQVNFDSVLLISDHEGMLNMFKALEASDLRGFLECSTRWSNQDDIQTLRFNAFKKVVLAQGVTAGAADILSLSTQLGDLVDYIRGGDAKKREGSSSSRPLPPPVNQGEGSGNRTSGDTVRTTEIAQRDILERLMAADRQRERERGSRSRSGSHKRRRY
ncbi:hypothetical protein F511_34423 [Dorcoceras hygrometricum]|uniref:Uncharacterized protein n=1 Tax=Dorcoceras hygrometricum TaxID=472368 RepID=A0A2Z7BVK5_9LAMI|nr:hypothetical protein F511_34423 [Dorcoceras hygrometricum]